MAFFHGSRASEVPTSIVPPVQTTAGLPVVFGCAPVHLTSDPSANVNKPVICYDWAEAYAAFGYSTNFAMYDISEVMFSQFQLYAVSPTIFVNVLDPAKHYNEVKNVELTGIIDTPAEIDAPILLNTLQVKSKTGTEEIELVEGTDYGLVEDIDEGFHSVEWLSTSKIETGKITLKYDKVVEGVTSSVSEIFNITDEIEIAAGAVISTVEIKTERSIYNTLTADEDFTAAYDDDGKVILTIVDDSKIHNDKILISYREIAPEKVKASDVIGGVSADGLQTKGLEWIGSIYTLFSMVPGIIAAPRFSSDPTVAAVMKAKALTICGLFRCIVLTDINTEEVKSYSEVNAWKNKNNFTGVNQVVCFPCVRQGDSIYRFSTHLLGVIGTTDAANDDVPYQSPSNVSLQATGLCLADGTEVALSLEQANLLNSQGVVTGLNFSGGWKSWGNYTGAYPSNTDPKDCFICVRRMFDWQYQTFILTYWQKVDRPLTPRLVRTVVDSEIVRLNGLTSRGFLLGATVKFLESENPLTDLMSGIFRIHSYITPPVPAQEIDDILEYDVNNFKVLFE